MAIIAFLDGVDPITGSRRGVTFDVSQAGPIAKRRPSPVNHQTNLRMTYRRILKAANAYYWNLTAGQKTAWGNLAVADGVPGPWGMTKWQAGCAMFFSLQINSYFAGDGFYANHPPHNPTIPPMWRGLTRIDKDTVRVVFIPSANWNLKRIYLRQARPGAGVRRWSFYDGYIAHYSPLNPNTPFNFTTHFQHLAGWNGRYWLGCQRSCGCRSDELLWDL